jgi:hypothetical protein
MSDNLIASILINSVLILIAVGGFIYFHFFDKPTAKEDDSE